MAKENYRSFKGELKNLQKKNDFIYNVEIELLNDATTLNGWRYENIEGHKDLFAGTPILCAYVNNGKTVGDGHNYEVKVDPHTKEEYASFVAPTSERIVGMLSENTKDFRVEKKEDGTTWIVGSGILFKWYSKELVDKIEKDSKEGKPMSISIETLVYDGYMDGDVEVETDYVILGTTILGDGVTPAVTGANIKALQEIASEFKQLKLRAASYIENGDCDKCEEKEKECEDECECDPEEEKPQDNYDKGVNEMTAFSMKQLAELSIKFDGYTVVAGGQDESCVYLGLMAKDGTTATYTMESVDDSVIIPEKIVKSNSKVVFDFGEEKVLTAFTDTITDSLVSEIVKANADIEAKAKEIEDLKDAVKTLTENEMKRRVSAAKAAAKDTLEKFNENREEKVCPDVLNELNEEIECGEFSEMEDKDCAWIGDVEVSNRVLALCAKKVMELDAISAKERNSQYVWEGVEAKHGEDVGDVASLLGSFGIN